MADIIKRHNPTYHLYADDTQLYVSFKLGSGDLLSSAKSSVEICVQENNNWMILNGLKKKKRKKPSCFYSVHGVGPVLIWKTSFKRYARHVISV